MAIGKAGLGFVKSKLKLFRECRKANLEDGGCQSPAAAALAKVDDTLANVLARSCGLSASDFAALGFPGSCLDANPADGFTRQDLYDCIRTSHDGVVSNMLALQYDAAVAGPLARADLACQEEVAKQSARLAVCVLKSVQKCRAAVMKGRLPGVPAYLCASDHAKTAAAIATCRERLGDGLRGRCRDAQVATLKVCNPDQRTAAEAETCLIDGHTVLTDTPAIDVPADLIDYEYATRSGQCGDEVVNHLDEECDGADDAACPGQCGAATVPDGYFACLCKNKPRLRVVEHAESDTDNGWTGLSADVGVPEGGGYVADLYDCDGSGLCTVGPSCSLAPHASCGVAATAPSGTTGDSICAGLGQGTCRKERTAVGPHCFRDIQKKCNPALPSDPVCDGPGDYCVVTLVGPPSAGYAGGVTTCVVSLWSEDIVGTANIFTGEATVVARQRARTYQNRVGAANKPCPICGGFCAVSRDRCESNADCPSGTGSCITAPVCSNGPNRDKVCRTGFPFGSSLPLFGTTSIDCLPDGDAQITSEGGVNLDVTRRSTGSAAMMPAFACTGAGFTGNACLGGTSAGRPCSSASECPAGDCRPQCFCPGQVKPNACAPACVGGGNDAGECTSDSECPGGFCHAADCRVDPGDFGSIQEGVCTHGPTDGRCSINTFRSCLRDRDCGGAGCPFCESGETCLFSDRACFVNGGIVRQGAPRTPEGTSVGIYCIPPNAPAVGVVAGFPGPAAFTQPELALLVP